jgi:low affinity Fe/Cu permease
MTQKRDGDGGNKKPATIHRYFDRVANAVARQAGRPGTFALGLFTVVVWALTGPVFQYSDTWQLVINTGTTIITFLMVFLIQNSQNRDSTAIQVKLDELIRAGAGKNFFVGIEHLTEHELERLRGLIESRTKPQGTGANGKARQANATVPSDGI